MNPQITVTPATRFQHQDRVEENWENSTAAQALRQLLENARIKYIVVNVPAEACPVCTGLAGTYPKNAAPRLPIEECSHPMGCRAFYAPYLDEVYP